MAKKRIALFSLIMTAFNGRKSTFNGRWDNFYSAITEEFGQPFRAAFSLCCGRDSLPAEIADGLSHEDAIRIAHRLEATGAVIHVAPTAKVDDVRYRAAECWPSRRGNGFEFSEIEGMILTLNPVNARQNIQTIRERNPTIQPWQIEIGINHQHPTHGCTRDALRKTRRFGEELAAGLREAYPEKEFILSYRENQVSFYQRGNGALESPLPPRPAREYIFCDTCRKRQPYTQNPPDDEFPTVEWGICTICGAETMICAGEELFFVGKTNSS